MMEFEQAMCMKSKISTNLSITPRVFFKGNVTYI